MKITIKKTHQAEITALREQLATALGELDGNAAELARLNERQQKLEKEISTLEDAADSESDSAAVKLATKRVQLEQCLNKIESLSNVPVAVRGESLDSINALLRQFARAAAAAMGPSAEAYAKEIAATIRPWCLDDANALAMAYTLPAPKSLFQTCTIPFGSYGASIRSLQMAITRADEILKGELAWSFDPKIAAESK